jgi:ribosomal protein L5
MNLFENYYVHVIKYDLINKFLYNKLKKVPKIYKIILNFEFSKSNIKQLCTVILALELIASRKGKFILAKKANLFLKIKKGDPVGCQIILQKKSMYDFLTKLVFEIFLKFKECLQTNMGNSIITFKLKNKLLFTELLNNYNLFNNNLTGLSVTIVSSKTNKTEFFYLINSFKQPLRFKKNL